MNAKVIVLIITITIIIKIIIKIIPITNNINVITK